MAEQADAALYAPIAHADSSANAPPAQAAGGDPCSRLSKVSNTISTFIFGASIVKLCRVHTQLQHLDLCSAQLQHAGAKIRDAQCALPLMYLNLSRTSMQPRVVLAALPALAPTLQRLHLQLCMRRPHEHEVACTMQALPELRVLNLCGCRLSWHVLPELAPVLVQLLHMQELDRLHA